MMDTLRYHFSCVADFWRGGLKKRTIVLGIVLAASALLGYFTCLSAPEVTNAVMEYFASVMAESGIVSETGTISALDLFLNNWIALLTCVAYGFFPFLFLPMDRAVSCNPPPETLAVSPASLAISIIHDRAGASLVDSLRTSRGQILWVIIYFFYRHSQFFLRSIA